MAEKTKKTKKAKVVNCAGCNKPVKRLKRYYRDGKFFCNKGCWRKLKASQSKEPKPCLPTGKK